MNNGYLAEIATIKELVKQGWEVYTATSGKSTHDIVAFKESFGIVTIQVKSTSQKSSTGSFIVELKSIRSNSSYNNVKRFDNKRQNILAIYIVDLDKVLFYLSEDITQVSTKTISLTEALNISEYTLEEIMDQ